MAKDVLAIANTGGGYIVVGVEDGTRRPVGLAPSIAEQFESKSINDKLKRFTGGHVSVIAAVHPVQYESATPVSIGLIHVPGARKQIPAQADGIYPDPSKSLANLAQVRISISTSSHCGWKPWRKRAALS
jgi:hypothetical protein